MSRRVLPIAVALGLVGMAFLLRDRSPLPSTPESAITAFFNAAEKGETGTCLRLLTPDLRRSLAASEEGGGTLGKELRHAARGLVGVAVTGVDEAPGGLVALDVELVFEDRNERQRMVLQPEGSGWLIDSMEAARRIEPPVPYGTPVFEGLEEDAAGTSGTDAGR